MVQTFYEIGKNCLDVLISTEIYQMLLALVPVGALLTLITGMIKGE